MAVRIFVFLQICFMGFILYLQPERISGHQYTISSDVWSTGITLLELAMNKFPFPTDVPLIDLLFIITQNEVINSGCISSCFEY
jgi:serine/threonine protein kinase